MLSHRFFDLHADKYDEWYDRQPGNRIFQLEVDCLRSIMSSIDEPTLEVGVGTGRFAKKLGVSIGIDPSINVLRMAQEKGVPVVRAAGEFLPFDDRTFGGVLLIVTICFLDDPIPVLRESYRVLSNGGKLLVAFVPRESPWGEFYGRKKRSFYSYARFYSVSEVKAFVKTCGFEVIGMSSTLYGDPHSSIIEEGLSQGYDERASFICVAARKG